MMRQLKWMLPSSVDFYLHLEALSCLHIIAEQDSIEGVAFGSDVDFGIRSDLRRLYGYFGLPGWDDGLTGALTADV